MNRQAVQIVRDERRYCPAKLRRLKAKNTHINRAIILSHIGIYFVTSRLVCFQQQSAESNETKQKKSCTKTDKLDSVSVSSAASLTLILSSIWSVKE